jgi:hypothetical protein
MVVQGSSECVVNSILMHVSCIKAHWVDEHNAVEGNRYKLQTKACHFSDFKQISKRNKFLNYFLGTFVNNTSQI